MGELSAAIKTYYDRLSDVLDHLYRESNWEKGVDLVRERVERGKQEALIMAQTIEALGLNVPVHQYMQHFLSLQTAASEQRAKKSYKDWQRMRWEQPYGGIHEAEERILKFNRTYQL